MIRLSQPLIKRNNHNSIILFYINIITRIITEIYIINNKIYQDVSLKSNINDDIKDK